MKKRILASVLIIGLLFSGCQQKELTPDPETGLYLKQANRTGKCSDETTNGYEQLEEFLKISQNFAVIPGINEDFLPKAVDQSPTTGYFYISGYFIYKEKNPFDNVNNPAVMVVLNESGQFIAEYALKDPTGAPFHSSVDGLAISEDTLYLSAPSQKDENGQTTYWIASVSLEKLEQTGHLEVSMDAMYQVPVAPDFLRYYDGTLWIGNQYRRTDSYYDAPVQFGTVYGPNDKDNMGSYLIGYDLSAGNDRLAGQNNTFSLPDPDKYYALPQNIQGVAFLPDGKIILDQSSGLQNPSQLMIMNPEKADRAEITVLTETVSCKLLEVQTAQAKVISALPLSTDMTVNRKEPGKIYILFDSASPVYDGALGSNYALFRTDYLWSVDLNQ